MPAEAPDAANPLTRVARAASSLAPEQRLAALAALGLWLSMFLPWYGMSVTEPIRGSLQVRSHNLSAFGAFSFVEAAVLLVSAGVLVLLFARAERRAFHLPGGDGFVIVLGGGWVTALIFYRLLDKPGTQGNARLTTTIGLQWGIFIALAAAGALAYAGTRVRAAHRPEPSFTDDPTVVNPMIAVLEPDQAPTHVARRRRPLSREQAEQLSFEVPTERPHTPDGAPPGAQAGERDPFGER